MKIFNKKQNRIKGPLTFSLAIRNNLSILNFLIVFAILLLFSYFMLFLSVRNQANLQVGKPAPQDIVLTTTISYVDDEKTELAKEEAKKSVSPLYKLDTTIQTEVTNNVVDTINKIIAVKSQNIDSISKIGQIEQILSADENIANSFLNITDSRLVFLKNYLLNTFNNVYSLGVRADNLDSIIKSASDEIQSTSFSNDEKEVLTFLFKKFIKPNFVVDQEATEKAIAEAVKNVRPVEIILQKGTKVIEKDKIITQEDLQLLQKIGLYKTLSASSIITIFLLALISAAIILTITRNKQGRVKKEAEVIAIILISIIAHKYLSLFSIYLFPIPLVVFTLIEFFNFKEVVLSSIVFLLMAFPLVNQFPFSTIVIYAISIFVIYFEVKEEKLINYFERFLIGGITASIIVLFYEMTSGLALREAIGSSLFVLLNFFGSSALSLVLVYIFEHLFNEATFLRLIELGDVDAPILKEMSQKAPGTYAHSLMVANISSQAALAIHANSLLTRVGALYHDIGKMLYPYYFTENQAEIPNIHNTISPNLSKVIIVNHVKDGIELAKKYRLPEDVIHFIETHHGRSVISYFYMKAKETDPDVNEDEFRYPGPLPDTKETTVVSLADAVEAASHSIEQDELDLRKIEELVNRIVESRLKDGELSNSNITFSELEKVKQSFVKTLFALYHKREKYFTKNENKS